MIASLEDALRDLVRDVVREELAKAQPAPAAPRLMSVTQAADRIGLSRAQLYKMITSGELPSRKVGGRRLVSDVALAAFIAGS